MAVTTLRGWRQGAHEGDEKGAGLPGRSRSLGVRVDDEEWRSHLDGG